LRIAERGVVCGHFVMLRDARLSWS
jgi:hypothetical protein